MSMVSLGFAVRRDIQRGEVAPLLRSQCPPAMSGFRWLRAVAVTAIVFAFFGTLFSHIFLKTRYHSVLGTNAAVNDGIAFLQDAVTLEPKFPDFSMHKQMLRSLTFEERSFYRKHGRLIVVGDIHGMHSSLRDLLSKIKFNHRRDVFIHTGDIIAKGPVPEALALLSKFTENNTLGVRGNQDQPIIEWRAYFEWIGSRPKGNEWLESHNVFLDHDGESVGRYAGNDPFDFISHGWDWGGNHWDLARRMSHRQYQYLVNLPIILHLAPFNAHIVHGGLLPMDPVRSIKSHKQPLAKVPDRSNETEPRSPPNITLLRSMQEMAVVTEIPQNTVPWNVMNIRSILNDGTITRGGDEGIPWPDLWNMVLKKCEGFATSFPCAPEEELDVAREVPLLARPGTKTEETRNCPVIPSLPWTKGLDSGCVYGRRLSAFIHKPHIVASDGEEDSFSGNEITFGDNLGTTSVVTIKCSAL
ncbi:Metallo-dependent phosphatase-like protein [Cantharellus anzutake]|uniref:Metallo-dependent phosphatase-like protein n=1 Tax=Cantharellus anzutake TaxID=1750568 RepID=UPI0019030320|nr:Metallo-dependent phosphatase-like protein [Cantharellus anzutake]KAF8340615.1 Metallo-dependent phosphatase-like protein [Cantharellus anzutake]